MEKVTLTAADGVELAARVYEPAISGQGNVVIGGAMGVRQDYYARFAEWLAGQGWRVTTFALRRIGHFGPFRSEQEGQLWPRMAQWLHQLGTPVNA